MEQWDFQDQRDPLLKDIADGLFRISRLYRYRNTRTHAHHFVIDAVLDLVLVGFLFAIVFGASGISNAAPPTEDGVRWQVINNWQEDRVKATAIWRDYVLENYHFTDLSKAYVRNANYTMSAPVALPGGHTTPWINEVFTDGTNLYATIGEFGNLAIGKWLGDWEAYYPGSGYLAAFTMSRVLWDSRGQMTEENRDRVEHLFAFSNERNRYYNPKAPDLQTATYEQFLEYKSVMYTSTFDTTSFYVAGLNGDISQVPYPLRWWLLPFFDGK